MLPPSYWYSCLRMLYSYFVSAAASHEPSMTGEILTHRSDSASFDVDSAMLRVFISANDTPAR